MADKDELIQPRLVVIEGKDKGRIIALKAGTTIVGRSKGDVLVEDPRVSRSHIAVQFDAEKKVLSFTDLKSLNGTLLNGKETEAGVLEDGDKLQVGNTLFDCQLSVPSPHTNESIVLEDSRNSEPSISFRIASEPEAMGSSNEPALEGGTYRVDETGSSDLSELEAQAPRQPKVGRYQRVRTWGLVSILLGFAYLLFSPHTPPSEVHQGLQELEILIQQGRAEQAVQKAMRLAASDSDAEIQFRLGKFFESQGLLDSALTAYGKSNLKKEYPAAIAHRVDLYLQTRRNVEAEDELVLLEAALDENPKDRELAIEVARLLIKHRQLNRSPEKTQQLAQTLQRSLAPNEAIGYMLEANTLILEKQPGRALEVLERALQLDGQDDWVLEQYAFAKLALGDQKGATQAVARWIELRPQNPRAHLILAWMRYNQKDREGAVASAGEVLQILKDSPENSFYREALHIMGQVYWDEGKTKESALFLRRSCELGFDNSCGHTALLQDSLAEEKASNRTMAPPLSPPPNPAR